MNIVSRGDLSPALMELIQEATTYGDASRASSTQEAYDRDTRKFASWCAENGLDSMPADPRVVAVYITHLARTHAPATINRVVSGIAYTHRQHGHVLDTKSPIIKKVMDGIRRTKGIAQKGSDALMIEDLSKMASSTGAGMRGLRDRAIILVGFGGALRRSEVAGLDVENLTFSEKGVLIHIARSKTDQEGEGAYVAVPYAKDPAVCAVRALKDWLVASGISKGPVFRGIQNGSNKLGTTRLSLVSINNAVKAAAEAANLDDSKITPHSLRAGLITSAHIAGKPLHDIMRHSRHKCARVAASYIRMNEPWENNAAGSVL